MFQAQALDDGHIYQKRLESALHRLELRAELYKQPERNEDQAAMIIEQVNKTRKCRFSFKFDENFINSFFKIFFDILKLYSSILGFSISITFNTMCILSFVLDVLTIS